MYSDALSNRLFCVRTMLQLRVHACVSACDVCVCVRNAYNHHIEVIEYPQFILFCRILLHPKSFFVFFFHFFMNRIVNMRIVRPYLFYSTKFQPTQHQLILCVFPKFIPAAGSRQHTFSRVSLGFKNLIKECSWLYTFQSLGQRINRRGSNWHIVVNGKLVLILDMR